MSNEYIKAADLTTSQLEELESHGSVLVDGTTYRAWRSDASGPWLQASAAADREYPTIQGAPSGSVSWDLQGESDDVE